MNRHGATCLAGPVTKARLWWIASAVEIVVPADITREATPSAAVCPEEDIRHDLVARVRREIAEGTYDTSAKWETALERLLDYAEQ